MSESELEWTARPVNEGETVATQQIVTIPQPGVWLIEIETAPVGVRRCRLTRLGPLPEEPEPTLEDVIGAPERIAEYARRFSAWAKEQAKNG